MADSAQWGEGHLEQRWSAIKARIAAAELHIRQATIFDRIERAEGVIAVRRSANTPAGASHEVCRVWTYSTDGANGIKCYGFCNSYTPSYACRCCL